MKDEWVKYSSNKLFVFTVVIINISCSIELLNITFVALYCGYLINKHSYAMLHISISMKDEWVKFPSNNLFAVTVVRPCHVT